MTPPKGVYFANIVTYRVLLGGKNAKKMNEAYKDKPPVLFCNVVYIRESITFYTDLGK